MDNCRPTGLSIVVFSERQSSGGYSQQSADIPSAVEDADQFNSVAHFTVVNNVTADRKSSTARHDVAAGFSQLWLSCIRSAPCCQPVNEVVRGVRIVLSNVVPYSVKVATSRTGVKHFGHRCHDAAFPAFSRSRPRRLMSSGSSSVVFPAFRSSMPACRSAFNAASFLSWLCSRRKPSATASSSDRKRPLATPSATYTANSLGIATTMGSSPDTAFRLIHLNDNTEGRCRHPFFAEERS